MFIPAEQIRKKFGRALREALIAHYGRLPPASLLCREFNLRARGVDSISQESARRWLRGLSIPTQDKLAILQQWLSLDLNHILCIDTSHSTNGDDVGLNGGAKERKPVSAWIDESVGDGLPQAVVEMLDRLSHRERSLVLSLLGLLANRKSESTSGSNLVAIVASTSLFAGATSLIDLAS